MEKTSTSLTIKKNHKTRWILPLPQLNKDDIIKYSLTPAIIQNLKDKNPNCICSLGDWIAFLYPKTRKHYYEKINLNLSEIQFQLDNLSL